VAQVKLGAGGESRTRKMAAADVYPLWQRQPACVNVGNGDGTYYSGRDSYGRG
jgi:hypothetical protein